MTIANEPTISCIAVSSGPPHFPESRRKMKLKRRGANVPVQPAVTILTNWAIRMVMPKGTSIPLAKNAMLPSKQPMPVPKIHAAPISVKNQ
jgi:hypothetical protein